MKKISQAILKISNLKVFLILLAAVIVLVIVPDFVKIPISNLKFEEYSHGIKMLDLTAHYTPEQAYSLLDNYGAQARNYYLYFMEPLDVFVPAIMGLILSVSATLIYKRIIKEKHLIFIQIVPLMGWLFDYLENIGVITMLINYPARLFSVARVTNIFTNAKNLFNMASIIILFLGLVILGLKTIFRKKSNSRV